MTYDVLLFDPYFCDLVITGLPELPRLGLDLFGTGMGIEAGGTFNIVRALHRLNVRVGWACDFGNDLFSQFVLSEIDKEGVDKSLLRIHDKPVRIFSLAFSYAHDRGFISYFEPLEPVERIPYLRQHRPKIVFLNVLETGPDALAFIAAAHDVGARVFVDSQSTSHTLATPGVIETLNAIDALLINTHEAALLTEAASHDEAGTLLTTHAPLVVLKNGADGAYAYTRDDVVHAPALRVEVVDTTGAGDCFNAGFVAAHLRGDPLETCLRLGNICGGLSTTAHSGTATPTYDEAMRYVAES